MLSQELEFSLNAAFQTARERRHEFITVEHLLMALLDNPSASRVIRACGGNLEELRRNLNNFLSENVPVLPNNSKIDTQPCKLSLLFPERLSRLPRGIASVTRHEQ